MVHVLSRSNFQAINCLALVAILLILDGCASLEHTEECTSLKKQYEASGIDTLDIRQRWRGCNFDPSKCEIVTDAIRDKYTERVSRDYSNNNSNAIFGKGLELGHAELDPLISQINSITLTDNEAQYLPKRLLNACGYEGDKYDYEIKPANLPLILSKVKLNRSLWVKAKAIVEKGKTARYEISITKPFKNTTTYTFANFTGMSKVRSDRERRISTYRWLYAEIDKIWQGVESSPEISNELDHAVYPLTSARALQFKEHIENIVDFTHTRSPATGITNEEDDFIGDLIHNVGTYQLPSGRILNQLYDGVGLDADNHTSDSNELSLAAESKQRRLNHFAMLLMGNTKFEIKRLSDTQLQISTTIDVPTALKQIHSRNLADLIEN